MALQIGDKIPEDLGIDQNGQPVKASSFLGKKIALYFYPKDNTLVLLRLAVYEMGILIL